MRAYKHWTWSRRVLVITAEPDALRDLANELSISDPQIVPVNPGRAALPLQGRALNQYLELERSGWMGLSARAAGFGGWHMTSALGSLGTVGDSL